jgi:hypothetical protein
LLCAGGDGYEGSCTLKITVDARLGAIILIEFPVDFPKYSKSGE